MAALIFSENNIGIRLAWRSFHTVIRWSASSKICFSVARQAPASFSAALLGVFCYRRAHLASIGLAIAATCAEDDLTSLGGNAGTMLFERSRKAPQSRLADVGTRCRKRRLQENPAIPQ